MAPSCSSSEDLQYVQNGSVDMTILSAAQYTDVLPLTNFPTMANGSQEYAVDYVKYIMFENEETATLIEQELTEANVKVLGVNAGGTNAFCAKTEITNYEGLTGQILGAMMNQTTYEELGATYYFSLPPDTYSDLQKGVIDCAALSLAGMVGLAWYEVAPYVVIDGMYSVSNYYTINLDVWNSLDADTQALFEEAAAAAEDNSFVLNDDELQNCIDTINAYNADHGIDAEVVYQDEEHAQSQFEIYMNNAFADCRTVAGNAGKTDEMEIILAAVAEYLSLET
ncbi:MAG: TRAP transporter substrate-binding protein DctP [Oscillospiraceae bacterium]|nr:TRAP transporter substrate-binding protein DctP [Oscillospiraceae bacterium]